MHPGHCTDASLRLPSRLNETIGLTVATRKAATKQGGDPYAFRILYPDKSYAASATGSLVALTAGAMMHVPANGPVGPTFENMNHVFLR